MNISACLSHNSDDWQTPSLLYKYYINNGYIDTFPFKADYDEFEKVYKNKKLFCNPPYSKLSQVPVWIKTQLLNGCSVHLLIPSRTDTKYFNELCDLLPIIYFIRGRLHFNDSKSAPFPSCIMIFEQPFPSLISFPFYFCASIEEFIERFNEPDE